ncbi:MAG: hypothetical protein GTO33_06740 [Acidobacteria bacterium]|nr:hypothetical protein [Acidobacteriota bacterium]NIO59034.1 hypothetical protein [Acidobacteriota bacterium]NIT10710.1 hypothetical protein [Acidobacteriota bacterium]
MDDLCRACKLEREHVVMVASGDGVPLRVVCDYCGSQHNYRGGGSRSRSSSRPASPRPRGPQPLVSERERSAPPMEETGQDLELLLRRIIREECGLSAVTPADKWIGGDLVLRPGRDGLQEKTIPIETFFNKVVMVRNRLRTLEQQVNASDLCASTKAKLQGYITGCYGSLTSFNVLFADEDDRFKGAGS